MRIRPSTRSRIGAIVFAVLCSLIATSHAVPVTSQHRYEWGINGDMTSLIINDGQVFTRTYESGVHQFMPFVSYLYDYDPVTFQPVLDSVMVIDIRAGEVVFKAWGNPRDGSPVPDEIADIRGLVRHINPLENVGILFKAVPDGSPITILDVVHAGSVLEMNGLYVFPANLEVNVVEDQRYVTGPAIGGRFESKMRDRVIVEPQDPSPVPLPGTLWMAATGLLMLRVQRARS